MKHTHWKIIAYNKINEQGNYIEPVEINLNDCPDEGFAIEKAKLQITRDKYTVRNVSECNQCGYLKKLSDGHSH